MPGPKNIISEKITLHREPAGYKAGYGLITLTPDELPQYLSQDHRLLHPMEKQYAEQLTYEQRRHSYLLGRIAAKLAIAQLTSQPLDSIFIDKGIFQFPVVHYITGEHIQVSISHCNNTAVALAFPEKHPMAIDMESLDAGDIKPIHQHLTIREKTLLSGLALENDTGFVILWTLKEALSKIFRTGLMMNFEFFEVHMLEALNGTGVVKKCATWESIFSHAEQYKGVSYHYENAIISIVLPGNTVMQHG